jgi:hypothetical protein
MIKNGSPVCEYEDDDERFLDIFFFSRRKLWRTNVQIRQIEFEGVAFQSINLFALNTENTNDRDRVRITDTEREREREMRACARVLTFLFTL